MHFFPHKRMPLTELLIRDQQLGEQNNVSPVICSSVRQGHHQCVSSAQYLKMKSVTMLFPPCRRCDQRATPDLSTEYTRGLFFG